MGAPRPAGSRPPRRIRILAVSGFSFIELLVVSAMLAVLASAVLPLSRVTMQRQREATLRRGLRDLRTAIDQYKDAVTLQQIGGNNVRAGSEGYPPDVETLVDGVERMNDASGTKVKFLRRIPYDPMTQSDEWGLRSYQDEPDSTTWG
ncbi:MAG: type II secretion system protein, partial [Vicinamibacterales bacterium]|nr:type II secretion system protein [Vicinamibacterales bacterium]